MSISELDNGSRCPRNAVGVEPLAIVVAFEMVGELEQFGGEVGVGGSDQPSGVCLIGILDASMPRCLDALMP